MHGSTGKVRVETERSPVKSISKTFLTILKWMAYIFAAGILISYLPGYSVISYLPEYSVMHPPVERSQNSISLAADAHDVLQVNPRNECQVGDKSKLELNSGVEVSYIYRMPDMPIEACNAIIGITENISASNPFDASKLDLINSQVSGHSGVTVKNIYGRGDLRVTIDGQSYMLRMLDALGPRGFYDYGDLIAMQLNSKYVANVSLIFRRGNTAWMLVESPDTDICILKESTCKYEETRLMMHDLLRGLKDIHDQACVSMNLLHDGIVTVRDTLGNVTGYKVIAIGHGTKGHSQDSLKKELSGQLWCLKKMIDLNLFDKLENKQSYMPYQIVVDDLSIRFGEEDRAMIDFLAVMCGKVEYPPVTISDLLEHHFITGKEPSPSGDIFGKRKYVFQDLRISHDKPGSSLLY